jgi:hypothetical protein
MSTIPVHQPITTVHLVSHPQQHTTSAPRVDVKAPYRSTLLFSPPPPSTLKAPIAEPSYFVDNDYNITVSQVDVPCTPLFLTNKMFPSFSDAEKRMEKKIRRVEELSKPSLIRKEVAKLRMADGGVTLQKPGNYVKPALPGQTTADKGRLQGKRTGAITGKRADALKVTDYLSAPKRHKITKSRTLLHTGFQSAATGKSRPKTCESVSSMFCQMRGDGIARGRIRPGSARHVRPGSASVKQRGPATRPSSATVRTPFFPVTTLPPSLLPPSSFRVSSSFDMNADFDSTWSNFVEQCGDDIIKNTDKSALKNSKKSAKKDDDSHARPPTNTSTTTTLAATIRNQSEMKSLAHRLGYTAAPAQLLSSSPDAGGGDNNNTNTTDDDSDPTPGTTHILSLTPEHSSLIFNLKTSRPRPAASASQASFLAHISSSVTSYNSLGHYYTSMFHDCGVMYSRGVIGLHVSASLAWFGLLQSLPRYTRIACGVEGSFVQLFKACYVCDGDPSAITMASIRDMSLEELCEIGTYRDESNKWYLKLKHELTLRPRLVEKLAMVMKERQMEARVLNRACDLWSHHILRHILTRWRTECELNNKLARMGQYLMLMTTVKPKVVFQRWKEWAYAEKASREKSRWLTAKEDAEKLKVECRQTVDRVRKIDGVVKKLRHDIDKLRLELMKQKAILNQPARQKDIRKKILNTICRTVGVFEKEVREATVDGFQDVFSGGDHNLRLAPLYTVDFKNGAFVKFGEYQDEDKYDVKKEEEIVKWRPGKIPSKEFTHCFDFINTRAGRVIKRFANYCILKHDVIQLAEGSPSQTPKATPQATPSASNRSLNPNGTPGKSERRLSFAAAGRIPFDSFEDMISCKNYVKILNCISALSSGKEIVVQNQGQDVRGLPKRFLEHHKNLHMAQMVVLHCKYRVRGKMGRYVDIGHLTRLDIPKSEAVIKKETERLKALKKKEGDTGVIVHIMSQYCGQRVHVEDTSDVRCCCLLSEIFGQYYHYIVEQWAVGIKDYAYGVLEGDPGNNISGGNFGMLESFDRLGSVTRLLLDPAGDSVWGLERHKIKELVDDLKKDLVMARSSCSTCIDEWTSALSDRARYKQATNEIHMAGWQGMCTTVLARKVRKEEDIDDGSFTTVRKVQVDNEFRRFGIIDEDEKDEICLAMKAILKTRIRDMRRIFQFYAASSDSGGVTELDHGECWKVVKDCKLQKDRKALPSVRVDLIFQSCTLDNTKKGLDRVQNVSTELGPTQFIEFLARLASYRYSKGTWPERLEKLLNEDILPNACTVDIDVFRERIAGDKCKAVSEKHKHNLTIIFKEYAAADDGLSGDGTAAGHLDTMNSDELVIGCREFKLVGPLLSERAVKVLFAYVQHDEEAIGAAQAGGKIVVVDEGDDDEMVYAEFVESMFAIGAQMEPDPYNVLNIRLDKFLSAEIITKALDMQRFVNKGLKKNQRRLSMTKQASRRGSFSKQASGGPAGANDSMSSIMSKGGSQRRGSFAKDNTPSRRPSFAGEQARRRSFSGKTDGNSPKKPTANEDLDPVAAAEAAMKAATSAHALASSLAGAEERQNNRESMRRMDSLIRRAGAGEVADSSGRGTPKSGSESPDIFKDLGGDGGDDEIREIQFGLGNMGDMEKLLEQELGGF